MLVCFFTEYGTFFLGWYSSCLLQHGERLLQLANQVFGPYKTPKQPPQGPLAQAQAVMRRLHSMIAGSGSNSRDGLSSGSSSTNSLAAVAAAATVAAAAAAGGAAGDASSVAAAALQAKGLLQHVQGLQQHHVSVPGYVAARMSSSSDDDGSSMTLSPTIGSSAATPVSCSSTSASTSCLTPQGSTPLLPPLPEQQSQQLDAPGSLVSAAAAAHAAAGASASSVWDQLASPEAQALATSILQQLQLQSSDDGTTGSLALMAAVPATGSDALPPVGAPPANHAVGVAAVAPHSMNGSAPSSIPTVSSISSSSVQDLDLAGLLSASQQHLASLSLSGSDSSRASDLGGSSSPRVVPAATTAAAAAGRDKLLEPLQIRHSNSSSSVAAPAGASAATGAAANTLAYIASSSDISMTVPTPESTGGAGRGQAALVAGPVAVPQAGGSSAANMAAVTAAVGAAAVASVSMGTNSSSSSTLMASASGGSLAGLATAAVGYGPGSMDCSSYSPEGSRFSSSPSLAASGGATVAAATAAPAATAAGSAGSALLQTFLEALSGLGLDVGGKPGQLQQQQQRHQPHQRRRQQQEQQQRLILTLKIAGVHWWYNSTSHASELTAGYYNTDSRDGYSPVLQLCEKYSVNLTLTCVEMCDAQHPSYALCGPEGLLRQIRARAAKQQVSLSGENALPIFTPTGVDAVALDRVVSNVRACRAAPLRSCSSWPGPATTSGSSDTYCGSGSAGGNANGGPYYGGNRDGNMMSFSHYQQQYNRGSPGGLHEQGGSAGLHTSYTTMGNSNSGYGQQHSFGQPHQQQHAYHHHYGAGMGGVSNILSTGRTFSELGTLLTYDAAAAAAAAAGNGNGGSSGHSQQQQHHQGFDASGGSRVPCGSNARNGSGGGNGVNGKGSAGQHGTGSGDVLLPAMRAFTFLRLGPEILQPDCHASWMRFMHRMLNERA